MGNLPWLRHKRTVAQGRTVLAENRRINGISIGETNYKSQVNINAKY
jgi:hypothetical protein